MSSLNVKYYISIAANEFTFSVVTFSVKFCVFALWYFPITSWMKKFISNLYLLNKSYSQQVGSLAQRLDTQGNIGHSVLHPSNVTNTEIHTLYKVWEKNSTSPALKTINNHINQTLKADPYHSVLYMYPSTDCFDSSCYFLFRPVSPFESYTSFKNICVQLSQLPCLWSSLVMTAGSATTILEANMSFYMDESAVPEGDG